MVGLDCDIKPVSLIHVLSPMQQLEQHHLIVASRVMLERLLHAHALFISVKVVQEQVIQSHHQPRRVPANVLGLRLCCHHTQRNGQSGAPLP